MGRVFGSLVCCLGLVACAAAACGTSPVADPAGLGLDVKGAKRELGPRLAKVGEADLDMAAVDSLAQAARELRGEFDLPLPADDSLHTRLDMAIELAALAEASISQEPMAPELENARERLLARIFLGRVLRATAAQPIDDADLREAHLHEIRKFMTDGSSDLYQPTRVDAALIGVGRVPNWQTPDGEQVIELVTAAEQRRLADAIKQACGDRVADLDDFIAIGRRFSQGHATVRLEFHNRLTADPSLSFLDPVLLNSLISMQGIGDVSQVLDVGGALVIVRRGEMVAGRGEDLASSTAALSQIIADDRARKRLEALLKELEKRLQVQTWPSRLADLNDEQPPS